MFLSHMAQWLALILCIILVAAVWYLFGRVHEIQREFEEHKKGVRHRVRRKAQVLQGQETLGGAAYDPRGEEGV